MEANLSYISRWHLQYHSPDSRWPVFGCLNYGTYLEKCLVKGLFHSGVPEDVKKEYETIEQLMAHAWYHYPMYDESMSKLLRTVELAVKLKCDRLSIPLNYKNKKGESRKENLVDLISAIQQKEPEKKLKVFLDHLRNLRNIFMHPERSSYVGGMLYNKIILTINILNILFAEEQDIVDLENLREERRSDIKTFKQKALGFQRENEKILAHNVSFEDIFREGKKETALISVDPVVRFEEGTDLRNQWVSPIFVELKCLKIKPDRITGAELSTGAAVTIIINKHPVDIVKVESFKEKIYQPALPGKDLDFPEAKYNPQLTFTFEERAREVQKFRYRHYHKLGANYQKKELT